MKCENGRYGLSKLHIRHIYFFPNIGTTLHVLSSGNTQLGNSYFHIIQYCYFNNSIGKYGIIIKAPCKWIGSLHVNTETGYPWLPTHHEISRSRRLQHAETSDSLQMITATVIDIRFLYSPLVLFHRQIEAVFLQLSKQPIASKTKEHQNNLKDSEAREGSWSVGDTRRPHLPPERQNPPRSSNPSLSGGAKRETRPWSLSVQLPTAASPCPWSLDTGLKQITGRGHVATPAQLLPWRLIRNQTAVIIKT